MCKGVHETGNLEYSSRSVDDMFTFGYGDLTLADRIAIGCVMFPIAAMIIFVLWIGDLLWGRYETKNIYWR